MKIRITEDGLLEIKRGNAYLTQCCPYRNGANCGDWCPHFGEVQGNIGGVQLKICHGTRLEGRFKNKRQ